MSREIIIGFSTQHAAWKSAPIRWCEDTEYSHVYVKFYSKTLGRGLIYHASKHSLHFLSLKNFRKDNKTIDEYRVKVTEGGFKDVLLYCIDNAGIPYGWLQLVGIGFVKLFSKVWPWYRNPFKNGDSAQVCNEVAARILDIVGIKIDLSQIDSVGPKWLHGVMEQLEEEGIAKRLNYA